MREKTVLIALAIIASMLIMVIPAKAWEYSDTWVGAPQTDNLTEAYGPMADKVQIIMYTDETAEFNALELGQIDVTDWPVDSAHYIPWTTTPKNASIAVVDTGPEYGMFGIDMRMTNDTRIYKQIGADKYADLGPNPAYTAAFGNPMANIWLRRAVAACIDRKYAVETIVSGNSLPLLGQELYSPANDPPYVGWGHPELNPGGGLKEITYAAGDGSADLALANKFLDEHGFLDTDADGKREYLGMDFQIELDVRQDHEPRKLYGDDLYTKLTTSCHLDVEEVYYYSAGARIYVMDTKAGHMYTSGWGLTPDPDTLYFLFHINQYSHPGRPQNYMYYPGSITKILVPYNGWKYNYTNVPSLLVTVDWGDTPYTIDFSDNDKTWKAGDLVWEHPQNYWSWEMMISQTSERAVACAQMSEEAIAFYVCGEQVYAARSFTAFSRFYAGPEPEYHGKRWKGVVNGASFGVWSTWSFYNMHVNGTLYGDGNETIRWGFRQPTMSLNPIYAEWVWDWYVLNQCYDSMIGYDPYQNKIDIAALATDWNVSTWDSATYGTCTKVTFHLRHDLMWSDGVPLTASDVVFTWGGRKSPTSLASALFAKGYPPAYWDGSIADMLSVAAPDPWTVIVYLDVYAYFALHSMSGWDIVLPEHIWRPIVETGDPTLPWNQPNVCSSGYIMDSTAQPTVSILLKKNTLHYRYQKPVEIWTKQKSKYTDLKASNATYTKLVDSLGVAHWLNKTETTKTVDISVFLNSKYIYENGAFKENVYPRTVLDGEKTVTVWKWTGPVGSTRDKNPNNLTQYTLDRTLANNVPWAAERGIIETELYPGEVFSRGWYYIKVDIHISTLEYWNGADWVVVDPPNNPFYCLTITYREYMIVTARTDVGGMKWTTFGAKTYQDIPDIVVDGGDLIVASKAFGSYPGHPRWNPQCDIWTDNVVDGNDLIQISKQFGWPPA